MTSKTIALSGAEIRADYSGGTNVWLRNDGTATVYASTTPGVTAGADGVVSIPAGQAAAVYGAAGTVYLLGTGSVQLVGSDYTACPFKTSAQAGGSGADEVARAAISAHAGNADIHVTADEKAGWNGLSNPNLLINPDFKINQRGITTVVGAFAADRWVGTYTDTGRGIAFSKSREYIVQRIENIDALIGREATATVYYDDGTADTGTTVISAASPYFFTESRTHCLVYQDNGIKGLEVWAASQCSVVGVKLELGSVATPFMSPDPATELAKCQRYYQVRTTNDIDPLDLRPSMRTITDIKAVEGGYAYVAEL